VRLSREAAAILAQRDVGALPVVESGGVIGMPTATDVIAARRPTASASK
jgi:CBS domain-containing protein